MSSPGRTIVRGLGGIPAIAAEQTAKKSKDIGFGKATGVDVPNPVAAAGKRIDKSLGVPTGDENLDGGDEETLIPEKEESTEGTVDDGPLTARARARTRRGRRSTILTRRTNAASTPFPFETD